MIEEGRWMRRTRKGSQVPDFYSYRVSTKIPFAHNGPSKADRKRQNEMIAWCREQFGRSNDLWNHRLMPEGKEKTKTTRMSRGVGYKAALRPGHVSHDQYYRAESYFLFKNHADAFNFVLRWR